MLAELLYLNIHHELPRIGMDIQRASVDTRVQRATPQGHHRPAQSHRSITQATVDIDSYPSRASYGARTMNDFTQENGQRGYSDIRQAISRHTQQGWTNADTASRQGHDEIHAQYQRKLSQEVSQQRYMQAGTITDPTITVYPGEVRGDIDPGENRITWDTAPKAEVTYNPGRFRGYLEYKGTIQRWTSRGKYDN